MSQTTGHFWHALASRCGSNQGYAQPSGNTPATFAINKDFRLRLCGEDMSRAVGEVPGEWFETIRVAASPNKSNQVSAMPLRNQMPGRAHDPTNAGATRRVCSAGSRN